MSLEQELKLTVNQEAKLDLASLTELMDLAVDTKDTSHLVSTYYDTQDLYLSKQKLGLRLRKHNEQWWQTVKTAGEVKDDLHQRDEWEHELQGPEWDIALLNKTPLVDIIANTAHWSTLAPLFTTDFIRESWQLTLADKSQVELAYDYGKVSAGNQSRPIHEIELELKSGDVNVLQQLAELLSQQYPLTASNVSKAQMGYELCAQEQG